MDPQQHSQNIQQQQHWQFASQQNQALVQQPGAAMSTQQMQYPPQQAQYGQANGYWAVQMPIQQMATTHTTTTTTTTNTATSAAQGGQGQWQQDQQYQGQAFATLPPQPQPQAVQWRQQYQHRKSTPTPPQPQQQAVQWQQEEQHHYNQQQHDLTQQQRFQNQQYQHSLQEPVQQQYQSPPQRMPPSAQIPAPNPPPPSRMDPTPPQQLVVQTPTLSASTANMQLGNTSNVVTTTQATRAERYQGEHAGGTARAEASRSGEQALVCFEQTVQALLSMVSRCPSGYPWYCDEDGYMCADGNHRVYHYDIDKAFNQPGFVPPVLLINTFEDPESHFTGHLCSAHPPAVDFWQPMHQTHARFMIWVKQMGMVNSGKSAKSRLNRCDCYERLGIATDLRGKDKLRARGYRPELGGHSRV